MISPITHTQQIGGVTVNFSVGRLDDMPRCAVCGRALCSHSDIEFAGTHQPIQTSDHPPSILQTEV